MSYELIWEPKGVIKRFFGHVTCQEVLAAGNQSQGDLRFDRNRYAINDFLDCTEFEIDYVMLDEIAAISGAAQKSNPNIRIAVVATLPEILAAFRHYASVPVQSYPTRLFTTRAEARVWTSDESVVPVKF